MLDHDTRNSINCKRSTRLTLWVHGWEFPQRACVQKGVGEWCPRLLFCMCRSSGFLYDSRGFGLICLTSIYIWGAAGGGLFSTPLLRLVRSVLATVSHLEIRWIVIQWIPIPVIDVTTVTFMGLSILLHIAARLHPSSPTFDLVRLTVIFAIFFFVISSH